MAIEFELVGDVPGAVAQPTAWGRTPQAITAFDGLIIGAYGDWQVNTGPITPWVHDPLLGTIVSSGQPIQTECINRFREIDGVLWGPGTDTRLADPSGWLARYEPGVGWSEVEIDIPTVIHLFDIIKHHPSGKLLAAGAHGEFVPDPDVPYSRVYESDDDGVTWSISMTSPLSPWRSYWLAYEDPSDPLNSRVVAAPDPTVSECSAFDGASWEPLADFFSPNQGAYIDRYLGANVWDTLLTTPPGSLVRWNGFQPLYNANTSWQMSAKWYDPDTDLFYVLGGGGGPWGVRGGLLADVVADGGPDALYYLSGDVETNLGIDGVPLDPMGGAVLDGWVYLGDNEGQLWRGQLPLTIEPEGYPPPPPPTPTLDGCVSLFSTASNPAHTHARYRTLADRIGAFGPDPGERPAGAEAVLTEGDFARQAVLVADHQLAITIPATINVLCGEMVVVMNHSEEECAIIPEEGIDLWGGGAWNSPLGILPGSAVYLICIAPHAYVVVGYASP